MEAPALAGATATGRLSRKPNSVRPRRLKPTPTGNLNRQQPQWDKPFRGSGPSRFFFVFQFLLCIGQKLIKPFRKAVWIHKWIRLTDPACNELLSALENLEGIGMVRKRDLSSGGQCHHSFDTVDVRLCCLNSGEVLAMAAKDEGLV